VQAAGATVVSEDQADGIEVSPLISYVSSCYLYSTLPRPMGQTRSLLTRYPGCLHYIFSQSSALL
jgi:hypothetical protein